MRKQRVGCGRVLESTGRPCRWAGCDGARHRATAPTTDVVHDAAADALREAVSTDECSTGHLPGPIVSDASGQRWGTCRRCDANVARVANIDDADSLLDELREAVTDEKHKANITASAGFELWEAAANRVDDALLACINAGASKDELADVSGRPIERVRVLSRLAKAWKLAHQVVGVHARDGITISKRVGVPCGVCGWNNHGYVKLIAPNRDELLICPSVGPTSKAWSDAAAWVKRRASSIQNPE